MKYTFYCLMWFILKIIMEADGETYRGLHRPGQFNGFVVGGVEVPISMYPHVATIIMDNTTLCGGSIISERVIVTAAHCIIDRTDNNLPRSADSFGVYLGTSSLGNGVYYKVCEAVAHENYNPYHYFYDIGVIILKNQIRFGPTIRKIKIAPDELWKNEGFSFTVAGFGMKQRGGGPSINLIATRMHFVNSNTCNKSQAFSPMIVPNHMFCMIGQRWTSDCYGDSGSGVIWKRQLVGLVSTGRDNFCGADMIPSMYTDVTFFRDWIQSKVMETNMFSTRDCVKKRPKTFDNAGMKLAVLGFSRPPGLK